MNLLIIQARMGSTRLPGKVLMKINHQSILENLIERISPSKKISTFVIATTTNTEDDAIEKMCKTKSWNVFRGSDWDVLERFYHAAKQFENVETVIRLTADCPLHHYEVVDFVVNQFEQHKVDYFSNSNNEPDFLEDGFDVEVFTFKALKEAWQNATLLSEREHVTPYIKNSGKYTCAWKKFNDQYQYKLSVDSAEDFKAVSMIFEALKTVRLFGMKEVVDLLKKRPDILATNKESVINSGYKKSIQEDKKIK